MLDDVETVSLRADPGEAPATRRGVAQERSDLPGERSSAPKKELRSPRRRSLRWILFLLLPIALIVGGYWYVTGGQMMSTDDAYVEADKVGVSTDVSGIVQEIDVTENQHVETGQVLYRLDDLPFRLALQRAEARRDRQQRSERTQGELSGYAGADQTGAIRHRIL
jgi:membrane fusion protein (multidrug efflux system)